MMNIQLAIVIDNGARDTKFGYAGEDTPRNGILTVTGHYSHQIHALLPDRRDVVHVGEEALSLRGILKLRYPVQYGSISNWWSMERLWEHIFRKELDVRSEEHPVLLSESSSAAFFNDGGVVQEWKKNREQGAQILFEKFRVPAAYWASQPVLAIEAYGGQNKRTGVVLDAGHHLTTIAAIHDGHILADSTNRTELAGDALLSFFARVLCEERGVAITTTVDFNFVRGLMEGRCYVARDYEAEMKKFGESPGEFEEKYEMPYEQSVTVGSELFRVPEILFQPSLAGRNEGGIHQIIHDTIVASPPHLHAELYSNIVLSGGSTLFPGLAERLKCELEHLAPPGTNVQIIASEDRKYGAWLGGSMLARREGFREKWISKQEYEEEGPGVIHRKCL